MPDNHYIEIDEEIISAVSRLRKSSEAENIFVFPKRALILQSIINLKLLGREADKLGKTIVVMTQDEQGARLAEKAGLRVQEYQDAALREHRQEAPARFVVRHGESIPMPEPIESQDGLRRSNEIGSSNFYDHPSVAPSIRPVADQSFSSSIGPAVIAPPEKSPRPLRVRNVTPPMQTTLNSMRDIPPRRTNLPPTLPVEQQPASSSLGTSGPADAARKERFRRLFEGRASGKNVGGNAVSQPLATSPIPPVSVVRPARRTDRTPWIWSIAGVVLLVGAVFGGYFFLRPEAIVAIEPQELIQTVKLSLVASVDNTSSVTTVIPARYVEEEKTIRLTRDATGKDIGNSTKASGLITISNAFSEASQSLVATTRFEMADGKLYRLIDGVTVPGTKTDDGKTIPGKVDARVMADTTGAKYNVSSGSFTIPGFKGGPKFEKITAEVKNAFVGGSDDGDKTAAGTNVSSNDLDAAKVAATEEAKKSVLNSLATSLKSGEVVLEPSFEVAVLGTPVTPVVGTVGETFEYEARFQVRGFIISEAEVKSRIDTQTTESGGVALHPYRYTVGYGTVLSNFETKRVDLTAESKVLFRAPLNDAALKSGLLGLDEEGIRTYLAAHPEIKRLQVEFKPKVFIATIPDDPERVTVNILESTNE
ncbi:MAG: hypothetical protein WAT81_01790 [Candidatus Moraniibacteriota bacterium]